MTIIATAKSAGSSFPDGITVERLGPDAFPTFVITDADPEAPGPYLGSFVLNWAEHSDRHLMAEALRMIADNLDPTDE